MPCVDSAEQSEQALSSNRFVRPRSSGHFPTGGFVVVVPAPQTVCPSFVPRLGFRDRGRTTRVRQLHHPPLGLGALGDERARSSPTCSWRWSRGRSSRVRSRGVCGVHYRVRAADGSAGWLLAHNLRTSPARLPMSESRTPARATITADADARPFGRRSHTNRASAHEHDAPTQPEAGDGGRRFGQHFETDDPPASPCSTSPKPAPVVDGGGRRFGQHFKLRPVARRSSAPVPVAMNGNDCGARPLTAVRATLLIAGRRSPPGQRIARSFG
jgi:hypothetical protein